MDAFTTPYNPNDGEAGGFPVYPHVFDVETYANFFLQNTPTQFETWCNSQALEINSQKSNALAANALSKAITLPPEMQSFARFSLLPETYNGGVVQWPGIPPEALRKTIRDNIAPQLIVNQRVDDVLKYSELSTHPWKPGWLVKSRDRWLPETEHDSKANNDDIAEAQRFLENCAFDKLTARERDAHNIDDFATFLAKLVRDSLTYDGMAVWTDMDMSGRVKAFKAMSSYNIRLCLPQGYMGDPKLFAVGVDEAGNVIHRFTRDQLVFYHRNPRPDVDISGYGYPEIEMTLRLIQGWQNIIDMNCDVFTRNATPHGMLLVKGGMTQKQLDILSRIWINMKRGITKSWALPAVPVPKDGDISLLDLTRLKEGADVLYGDWLNMLAGMFCAMYRFPVRRLGYHISGRAKDNTPPETPTTTAPGIEDYDPYISVLLRHIEQLINDYIVWTRWPHLKFEFSAKNPKEDARAYESRVLACTVDERRALSDMAPLETLGKEEDEKRAYRLLGMAPVDPAMAGVYQTIIQGLQQQKMAEDGLVGQGSASPPKTPGASFTSKKDPARAEDHGHMSGVRRDSAAESARK
jgi:hypothetical protein